VAAGLLQLQPDAPVHRRCGSHRPGAAPGQGGQASLGAGVVRFGCRHQALAHDRHRTPMPRVGQRIARYAELVKPYLGQVAAPDARVFNDVAGDVGELHGQAQIACPVEYARVTHAHHPRHHQADDACDVVAVHHDVIQLVITMAGNILGKPLEQIERLAARDRMAPHHFAQRREGRIARRFASTGCFGLLLQRHQARACLIRREHHGIVAGLLAVDDVIAVPAPGVQQHRAAPGLPIE